MNYADKQWSPKEKLEAPMGWKDPFEWGEESVVWVDDDLFAGDLEMEYVAAVFGVMGSVDHQFLVETSHPGQMSQWFHWEFSETLEAHGGERDEFRPKFCDVEAANRVDMGVRCCRPVWPLPNVWLGVQVTDQSDADERIPPLLECPAAGRFVRAEPLVGEIDFFRVGNVDALHGHAECPVTGCKNPDTPQLDWVIVGGDSTDRSRLCRFEWVHGIIEQCREAEVPCYVTKLGANVACWNIEDGIHDPGLGHPDGADPDEWPDELRVREVPESMNSLDTDV